MAVHEVVVDFEAVEAPTELAVQAIEVVHQVVGQDLVELVHQTQSVVNSGQHTREQVVVLDLVQEVITGHNLEQCLVHLL